MHGAGPNSARLPSHVAGCRVPPCRGHPHHACAWPCPACARVAALSQGYYLPWLLSTRSVYHATSLPPRTTQHLASELRATCTYCSCLRVQCLSRQCPVSRPASSSLVDPLHSARPAHPYMQACSCSPPLHCACAALHDALLVCSGFSGAKYHSQTPAVVRLRSGRHPVPPTPACCGSSASAPSGRTRAGSSEITFGPFTCQGSCSHVGLSAQGNYYRNGVKELQLPLIQYILSRQAS